MERNLSEAFQGETFQLFCRHSSIPYAAQLSNSASVRFNLYIHISISVYAVVCAYVSCSFCCCVNHVQFAPCSQAQMIDAFIWTAEEKRSPCEVSVFWARPICRAWSELMYNSVPPTPHARLLSMTMMFWSPLTPASFILLPLICLFGVNYPPFWFPCSLLFFGVSVISFFLFSPFSAVDHSGSVGSGQPLVNAIRTDSALIGGTAPFIFQHCSTVTPHLIEIVLIVIL